MPQTGVKHEFFTLFAAKVLKIFGIPRKHLLWITLCIDLFQRVILFAPACKQTVISIIFIQLITISLMYLIIDDILHGVDIHGDRGLFQLSTATR